MFNLSARFANPFFRFLYLLVVIGLGLHASTSLANEEQANKEQKILHIDSFSVDSKWSDGINLGIESRLLVSDVNLQRHYMHAREQRTKEEILKAAEAAIARIEIEQPDLVIVSDDFAVQNVLAEHFQNSELPFIYCGVNWSVERYNLSKSNTAGIVETTHIAAIIDLLKSHGKGTRIGLLSIDALSEKLSFEHYQNKLGISFEQTYFVEDMAQWESAFLKLQDQVDLIYLENPDGILGWNVKRAEQLVKDKLRVPIGSSYPWLAPFSLFTITNVAQEQGWWAAEMAIQVLQGKSTTQIPSIKSKEGKLIANIAIANSLGIRLSTDILKTAEILGR